MTLAKKLYRSLSSHIGGSFLDDGSTHSVSSNLIAVVPSSGVVDSPRWTKQFGQKSSNKSPTFTVKKDANYPIVSFIIVYTMIFFNGCCFTAVVPSVPFYLQVLSAPPSFLGWVVSFYSLGQIFGSPTAGCLTSKLTARTILTMSSALGLVSSTLYATAPIYMFILISRLLTGISAGIEFTTELTFIAKNTTPTERTTYLASVTAVNVVGFIMGPALGSVLATLDIEIFGLKIDQYTGPGWLLAVMFFIDLAMIQGLFQDHELLIESNGESTEKDRLLKKNTAPKPSYGVMKDPVKSPKVEQEAASEPPPSLSLVLSLILVQFTVMCGFSVLETITSPLAQEHFDWDVQECNLLFTGGGVVSLVAYVIFVIASKWVQDRWLIVYALTLCTLGFVLAIDWTLLESTPQWVSRMLPSYRTRFLAGYMVMNAGFMTGRPVTFALYSKLIASEYQGAYLGWMVAGGSAARTLGPFAAVAIYYGIEVAGVNLLALFGTVGIFHIVCLMLVMWQWVRLLPGWKGNESSNDEILDYDTHESDESCGSSV